MSFSASSYATLGALGVVYGDLGTSPLYTLRAVTAAFGRHLDVPTAFGSLSLIIWTLTVIISVKYCLVVMRADNRGEGGIFALMSLICATRFRGGRALLAVAGVLGASLIYGDGVITPSISVLSALEGMTVAAPTLTRFVFPAAVVILIALFAAQQFGTRRIGAAFGPLMLLWFAVIAALGVGGILRDPAVLWAINPVYAIQFFTHHWLGGFIALGGIFLCVTGGEALYADMGHFGRVPIRIAWYGLVLPALVLNYAGQVAGLAVGRSNTANPFFELAPAWAILPLVALATVATIIASQAIIAGAFSLTRQAMQLGWFPGLTVIQTSDELFGQIYIPIVNWLMMAATLFLTAIFRSSALLAGAYGMSVATTMVITTLLLFSAMRHTWQWPWTYTVPLGGLFLMVDLTFFAANLTKLRQGGWIPLAMGLWAFFLMTTWRKGIDAVHRRLAHAGASDKALLSKIQSGHIKRVPGTAVFLSRATRRVPALIIQHIEHMGSLHAIAIELTIEFVDRPRVNAEDRIQAKYLGGGFWRVRARFGFIESTDLVKALESLKAWDPEIDFRKVIYFGARDYVDHDTSHPRLSRWRLRIFSFLYRNSAKTVDRFKIPSQQFVEIARQVLI
jgi:KUP system potassium uptake protein